MDRLALIYEELKQKNLLFNSSTNTHRTRIQYYSNLTSTEYYLYGKYYPLHKIEQDKK